MPYCNCIFYCLRAIHSVEVGAKRYAGPTVTLPRRAPREELSGCVASTRAEGRTTQVDAVADEKFPEQFPSGSVVASPSSICPCWLGASGPLTNQNTYSSRYADAELQKEAAAVMREAMRR